MQVVQGWIIWVLQSREVTIILRRVGALWQGKQAGSLALKRADGTNSSVWWYWAIGHLVGLERQMGTCTMVC